MARRRSKSRCAVVCLTLLHAAAAYAFQAEKIFIEPRTRLAPRSAPSTETTHLRVDTSLVLIPANVSTDVGGRIADLAQGNFRVFDDGVEQPIRYFAFEDTPISIGLLLDTSGSMGNKMRQATAAAAEVFRAADAGDEFFLVEFNDRAKLTVPFTSDTAGLLRRVIRSTPLGRTALLDAVQLGVAQMKHARNQRKALIILSDGADNRSRSTFRQAKDAVIESGVQVFAMGIFDALEGRKASLEEQNGPKLLDELTAESGGTHFRAATPDELPAISARISRELRSQYLLGYMPDALQADGKYHRVRVEVVPPPHLPALRVHYRPGFYAPAR